MDDLDFPDDPWKGHRSWYDVEDVDKGLFPLDYVTDCKEPSSAPAATPPTNANQNASPPPPPTSPPPPLPTPQVSPALTKVLREKKQLVIDLAHAKDRASGWEEAYKNKESFGDSTKSTWQVLVDREREAQEKFRKANYNLGLELKAKNIEMEKLQNQLREAREDTNNLKRNMGAQVTVDRDWETSYKHVSHKCARVERMNEKLEKGLEASMLKAFGRLEGAISPHSHGSDDRESLKHGTDPDTAADREGNTILDRVAQCFDALRYALESLKLRTVKLGELAEVQADASASILVDFERSEKENLQSKGIEEDLNRRKGIEEDLNRRKGIEDDLHEFLAAMEPEQRLVKALLAVGLIETEKDMTLSMPPFVKMWRSQRPNEGDEDAATKTENEEELGTETETTGTGAGHRSDN